MDISDTNLLILALGSIGLGILMLIKGGDWTIDSAVVVAEKSGIPKMIIGFTIVAFGTSLPELIVAVNANLKDMPGIALGNVIGSNIANILLVIAVAALFAPIVVHMRNIVKDMVMLFASTLFITYIMMEFGYIAQGVGAVMVLSLAIYVLWQLQKARQNTKFERAAIEAEEQHLAGHERESHIQTFLYLLLGLAGIALGAEILVRGAEVAATIVGVPSALIGLTLIAIGTSLPELSTCLMAVKKGEGDIIVGNIVGSNVFNILMIIGVTAAIKAIPEGSFAPQLIELDIKIMAAVSFVFGFWLLWRGKLSKISGIIMLALYAAYMGMLYIAYMT